MAASAIGSPMLKARLPLLLQLPDRAWFDIELMHKDIRLVRRLGSELATPLPMTAAADRLLTTAGELGYAHRDLAALHEVLGPHARPRRSAGGPCGQQAAVATQRAPLATAVWALVPTRRSGAGWAPSLRRSAADRRGTRRRR